MSAAIEASGLAFGYRRRPVGTDFSLVIEAGEVLCLLGPNGSGKTTLFKTLLGLLPPQGGTVRILGRALANWTRTAFARHVGYVPQAHAGLFPFRVEDVVLMGRTARIGRFDVPSRHDHQVAAECLAMLGIAHLLKRDYTEISGGERQLALIARALAQEPKLLVMDEPTASLDFGNQIRVLEQIDALRDQGMAVLMSTHQPEHARRVADRIALLDGGRLLAVGLPQDMAAAPRLAALYGVTASAVRACLTGVAARPGARTSSSAPAGPERIERSHAP